MKHCWEQDNRFDVLQGHRKAMWLQYGIKFDTLKCERKNTIRNFAVGKREWNYMSWTSQSLNPWYHYSEQREVNVRYMHVYILCTLASRSSIWYTQYFLGNTKNQD